MWHVSYDERGSGQPVFLVVFWTDPPKASCGDTSIAV